MTRDEAFGSEVAGIERDGRIICRDCVYPLQEPNDWPIDRDDAGYEYHPVCAECSMPLKMRAPYPQGTDPNEETQDA